MENVLDGKKILTKYEEEIKQEIKNCIIRPSVAIIEIGNTELNSIKVKEKEDICNAVGIYFRYYAFDDTTPELTIINKIKELNNDDYVNGIVVQLPLLEKYNEKRILNTIVNSKDIEGLTDINVGRLTNGRKSLIPYAAFAIIRLLNEYNISLEGKEVVLVGKGKTVGRPLIHLLLNEGATLTVCHSKTKNLKKYTSAADIVISATGVPNLIKEDMISEDSLIIDAGYTLLDGKLVGDVELKAIKKASMSATMFDSINPVIISMFLKNIMFCYNNKK